MQFDIYANRNKDTNKVYPFFIDVQNDLLDSLNSRIVVPLTPRQSVTNPYPENLCPQIELDNKHYLILSHQITSISVNMLKKQIGSVAEKRDEIIAAIDFLVTGI